MNEGILLLKELEKGKREFSVRNMVHNDKVSKKFF
jgi:hypothetical protein